MPQTPILKRSSVHINGGGAQGSGGAKKVVFHKATSARSLVQTYRDTGDTTTFTTTFNSLRASQDDAERLSWFTQMTECVPLLDKRVDQLVLEFLKIPWERWEGVVGAAHNFVVTLVTNYNYHTHHVLQQLFSRLVPEGGAEVEELVSVEEVVHHRRLLATIRAVHHLVPLCQNTLLVVARKVLPYHQRGAREHAGYTLNLLRLASLLPSLRLSLLEIIITNMVTIDVHIPRAELALLEDEEDDDEEEEEIFEMDVEESSKPPVALAGTAGGAMQHRAGNTLDVLMTLLLQYIHDTCHGAPEPTLPPCLQLAPVTQPPLCRPGVASTVEGGRMAGCQCGGQHHHVEALKLLYGDLREVFAHIILSTQASSHVQFLLFYFLAVRPGLATFFLEFLRCKKFEDPNCARETRANAMGYMGSLLARGKFIPFSQVHSCLEVICLWCNSYIDKQEKLQTTNYEDLLIHSPFYSACQTVFYVFTFRYREYTENPKKLSLARGLNLERLVLCRLNPLRVCAAPIVNNFAAVARRFQLAYCYTIMENNRRLGLPTQGPSPTLALFFPFDPYLLRRSKMYIASYYREFDGLPEDVTQSPQHPRPTPEHNPDLVGSPRSFDFSYGTSPGYRKLQSAILLADDDMMS